MTPTPEHLAMARKLRSLYRLLVEEKGYNTAEAVERLALLVEHELGYSTADANAIAGATADSVEDEG